MHIWTTQLFGSWSPITLSTASTLINLVSPVQQNTMSVDLAHTHWSWLCITIGRVLHVSYEE
eukprot:8449-Eustigmatos_ZCMA.PRE.1